MLLYLVGFKVMAARQRSLIAPSLPHYLPIGSRDVRAIHLGHIDKRLSEK